MADAAYAIFNLPARSCTGNFFVDDTFLASRGVGDFSGYRIDPATDLRAGMFLREDDLPPPGRD